MRIDNFEATGLERVEAWLARNAEMALDEQTLGCILKTINLSFVLEGIDRVQSTLLCELNDSYVQQSQRYVAMRKDAYFLPELGEDARAAEELTQQAFDLYARMSQLKEGECKGRPKPEHYRYGIPIEDARYILPLAAKTNLCLAMSGDKLFDLFRLLKDERYGALFEAVEGVISSQLPPRLAQCLAKLKAVKLNTAAIADFHADYFSRITHEENLLLLENFNDLDHRVAIGALTSTAKQTPSQTLQNWAETVAEKEQSLVKRVLGYGHDSIAEQARSTFGMMCSMVTYHQQLRHRLSRNQREELAAVVLDETRAIKLPESIKNSLFCDEFQTVAAALKAFRVKAAKKHGVEKALAFLLNCDQIKLILSLNARADASMLADRTCMNAQWEIRELAIKKLKILRALSPVLYEKALPSCVLGVCREGKLSCGKQMQVREQFSS